MIVYDKKTLTMTHENDHDDDDQAYSVGFTEVTCQGEYTRQEIESFLLDTDNEYFIELDDLLNKRLASDVEYIDEGKIAYYYSKEGKLIFYKSYIIGG